MTGPERVTVERVAPVAERGRAKPRGERTFLMVL